jgi:hypothetical protein
VRVVTGDEAVRGRPALRCAFSARSERFAAARARPRPRPRLVHAAAAGQRRGNAGSSGSRSSDSLRGKVKSPWSVIEASEGKITMIEAEHGDCCLIRGLGVKLAVRVPPPNEQFSAQRQTRRSSFRSSARWSGRL